MKVRVRVRVRDRIRVGVRVRIRVGVYCTDKGHIFTARCTLVQSAVLPSHVVCLSVCLSVCNVGEL